MNGYSRLALLALAALLRWLARLPLWTGRGLAGAANRLEALACGRQTGGRFVP